MTLVKDVDGLFGASESGSDTLLGKVEEMVRGGDVPRKRKKGGKDRPGGRNGKGGATD